MKRFIEGENRAQATLFPESLDEYVAEDNPVRVIEVFIDQLDLYQLGFEGVNPKSTGRPSYHPSSLLKIYVYGYLNRVQSSRRLEQETRRNVELMWLTSRLSPDFKTIADFRKDNGKAIRKVCVEFVSLCRRLDLLTHDIVAIDGSKFKAVNNRDRNFTQAKMKLRMKEVNDSIDRYLKRLDSADRKEKSSTVVVDRLDQKLKQLREEMERLKKLEKVMLERPDKQISLTDPDCRSMKSRGTGIVGYNVQTAVDAENHLIVAHEVTNEGSDRAQLFNMANQARDAMSTDNLTVVADRGYFKGEEILDCHNAKITTFLPKPQTSNNQAKGLFGRNEFKYIPEDNAYYCPAGERLKWRMTNEEKGKTLHRYWSSVCQECPLKSKCTTGKQRRITRWEHEEVIEQLASRLTNEPDKMRIRKNTVEHPFGTLKMWMGWTHFQMREFKNVKTEMSLHVLAYNMKRVINIIGVKALLEGI